MEIVNIEAGTFGRMSAALEKLVSKLQNENKLEQGDGLEEWLDNQDVCQQLKISPSKLLTLRRSGAIAYSRIDRKIYYKREDIRKFMERELKKLKTYKYGTHTAQRREPRSHPLLPASRIPRLPMGKNKEKYRPVLNGERYLTEAELSGVLKVTQRTLIEHRTNGKLPFYKFGGRILYKESDIIRILEQNRMEAFNTD